jgi:hypothetical protein
VTVSPWNVSALKQSRADNVRRARNAAFYAAQTTGETQRVWRAHCREKVAAARADNRLIVRRWRAMSAGMFLRKTIGGANAYAR